MNVVLTRAQRRVFADTAAAMDGTSEEDRAFFLSNPGRSCRVRLASSAEVDRHEVLSGKSSSVYGSSSWLFTLVRQLAPGARMRTHIRGSAEMARGDIGESAARKLWDIAAEQDPSIRAYEAEVLAKLRPQFGSLNDGSSQ